MKKKFILLAGAVPLLTSCSFSNKEEVIWSAMGVIVVIVIIIGLIGEGADDD